ncbi:hypothetical protein RA27_20520 [Ruegeria sp. ANG-R]|uniref:hypothetical protein n=1 Tax=Ruegeria sp. ANG-R TaxID=1577903 RepID=UPI00057CD1F2|nr:hypothetical protein [Ruegeria sp. ANG-R]KIC38152.1 hypothetical protein RA27_20520 [Ruegeria sp. ANG-R]
MSTKSTGQSNVATTRKVEVFRPGTFRAMNGQEYAFTEADVAAMASGYDPDAAPAPVVVGHPKHDDPAFGWVQGFEVNESGTLVAELDRLAPEFVSAVEEGRYRKVSMKFFSPDASNNPVPGSYYPRHLGFLGGAAPAVSGLTPVEFAESGDDELVEVAFSLPDVAESSGSLFRRIREFFIEKYGLDAANEAVPEYHIRWIEQAGDEPESVNPGFSQPEPKETSMPGDPKDLVAREANLAKRERALRHNVSVAFADDLIAKGKLLPVQRDGVAALLDELGGLTETEISFSDDGTDKTTNPSDLLKDILNAQPEIVPQGETDLENAPGTGNVSFASTDGLSVDPEGLAVHGKAVAFQKANPGTAYIDAVVAVEGA